MVRSTRRALCFTSRSILICTLFTVAAAAADDPGGWSKAKWGMTEPQIASAFGADRIVHIPLAAGGAQPGVDIDLVGAPFRAMFGLKDGRLAGVNISPRQEKDRNDQVFESLVNALVEKYGRPWKSETGQMLKTTEYQWSLPTTVITASFTTASSVTDICILDIHYGRRSVDPL